MDERTAPRDPAQFQMPDRTAAPALYVRYQCPQCGSIEVLDAYDGPPRCVGAPSHKTTHALTFLVPLRIESPDGARHCDTPGCAKRLGHDGAHSEEAYR